VSTSEGTGTWTGPAWWPNAHGTESPHLPLALSSDRHQLQGTNSSEECGQLHKVKSQRQPTETELPRGRCAESSQGEPPGARRALPTNNTAVSPDNRQLSEGHRGQREAIWESDELHCPGTLGCIVLQALSHILLF
jgi:hypothetical protein